MRFFVTEKKHNIYMFYGDLDDIYITKNLQKQTVFSYINDMLVKEGFDRIVFYSGAGNLGKFTLDKKSAILSIAKNSKFANSIDEQKTDDAPKKKSRRISSANRLGSINLSDENASQETFNNDNSNNTEIEDVKYSEQEMLEGNFKTELVSWMKDKNHRTAVVFCNMWDFMTNTTPDVLRSYSELMMNGWERGDDKENLYLFLYNGNIGNTDDFTRLTDRNGVSSLFVRKGENMLDFSRVMYVGLPQHDEIENLLNHLRIVGENGKRIAFEYNTIDTLVKSLVYCTRRILDKDGVYEDLRKIKNRIMNYAATRKESVVEINDKVLAKIYNMSIETQKPLELLCSKEGWEKPASRIKKFVDEAKLDAEELSKDEKEKDTKEPLAVLRFGGIEDCYDHGKIPNFALLGNPGVGKSEIARLIGKILNDAGILSIGHTVEVTKNDLVSQYVGGTPSRTMAKIQEAQGGVLFIDEAHLLYEDPKDGSINYCKEAISTIVGALTNPSLHFCLILAGYKSTSEYPCGVDKMIESDPGLSSRITKNNIITIDNYSIELLTKIFKRCITDKGYEIDKEIEDKIQNFIDTKVSKQDIRTFGNARTVISWAEELVRTAKLNHRGTKTIFLDDFEEEERVWLTKDKKTTCEEIYNEIDSKYTGFDFLKDIIAEENRRIEDEKRRGVDLTRPNHKIFVGNPGTGKTTAAKLLAEFYGLAGVMGGRNVVELNAAKLKSHDHKEVLEKYINEAVSTGKILFIDEAHNLAENHFGREVIHDLMNPMTENPSLVTIFAVYTSKFDEFVKVDEGLTSRVDTYTFPDYTGKQMYEIFQKSVVNNGFKCTDDALRKIKVLLDNWYTTRTSGFGNARSVEKLIKDMHKQRLIRCEMNNITEGEEYYILTEEDIPNMYKDIIDANSTSQTIEEVLNELERYAGWKSLKKLINDKHKSIVVHRKDSLHGTKPTPGHYFFTGDPGTGKTTAGSIMAKAFFYLGLTKENKYLKVSASDLVAGFMGQTAIKTKELLQSARHGVLFVDEAYILGSGSELTGGDSYNQQAINEIVGILDDEEYRSDTAVIFAGYKNDMDKFMEKNQGMSSRIQEVFFERYTPEEAYQIFKKFVHDGNFEIGAGVKEKCTELLTLIAGTEKYANGRTARKIYEKTLDKRADRIYETENPSDMELSVIFEEDVPTIEEFLQS